MSPAHRLAVAATVVAGLFVATESGWAQSGSDGPVTPEQADAIRDTLQRPPAKPPFDAVDAVALPFKVLFFPLHLLGLGFAELAGFAIKPDPKPIPIVVTLQNAGVRAGLGTIGPRSGIAVRLGYGGLPPFFLESAVSIRLSQRHRAGLLLQNPSGQSLEAAYTFWRNAEPYFYGVGVDTERDERNDYLWDQQTVSLNGATRKRVSRSAMLLLAGDLAYEDNRVDRGFSGRTTDIQDTRRSELYGVSERVKYVRAGASIGLDLTYARGLQRRGLNLTAGYQYYRGIKGTDSDFQRIETNLFFYLPLNTRQQLAIQGMTETNRGQKGEGVPFYHLAAMGSEQGGRAYSQQRFRHLAMAAFMVEWRWEVWQELHGRSRAESFLFYDSGSVADRVFDIQLKNMRRSIGFGFRLVTIEGSSMGGYMAFGDEGIRLRASLSTAF